MTAKLLRFRRGGYGHRSANGPSSKLATASPSSMEKFLSSDIIDAERAAGQRAEETALLLRLKSAQDPAAFDALFQRFAGKLKAYLMKLGSSADLAENVVQEVMVTVWTKARLFDESKASARTWIFTLVRNRYIDLKRAEGRQADAYERYASADSETETPGDEQFNHTAGQQISALLEKLPQEQAEILLMAYVEGKSHREISAQLNVPIGTTKSRLRLAFQRLRKLMDVSE